MTPETIYALISEEVYLRSPQNAGLNISGHREIIGRSMFFR
jgi:hypothetical protein